MNAPAPDIPVPHFSPDGDSAVRVEFGQTIDPSINRRVHAFCAAVDAALIHGVTEWVPAYATATVYYDPTILTYTDIESRLAEIALPDAKEAVHEGAVVEVPVLYGGEFGPDLARIAEMHGLTSQEVIDLHCGRDYLCYMIGFMPGFPYLGEVDERLRTPRLATPRTRVAAGSVAIAEAQTGIYPRETPGGWNIIGRTDVRLFDPLANPPSRIRPDDTVRFVPVQPD
jgi:inhibitor of KinA